MIVVAGTLVVDPGDHDRFLAAAAGVVAATREEAGCGSYDFWADPGRAGRFLVFEEWESAEHLEAHLQSPHLASFRKELAGIGLKESSIRRYSIEAIRPL